MNKQFAIQSLKDIFLRNSVVVNPSCIKWTDESIVEGKIKWTDESIVDKELGDILDKICLDVAEDYEREDYDD